MPRHSLLITAVYYAIITERYVYNLKKGHDCITSVNSGLVQVIISDYKGLQILQSFLIGTDTNVQRSNVSVFDIFKETMSL